MGGPETGDPGLRGPRAPRTPSARAAPLRRRQGRRPARRSDELRAIAEETERRIGLPLDRGPAVSSPAPPPAEEAKAASPEAPQPQPASAEPSPAPKRTLPPAISGEGAGWEWIIWVRAGLRDGSVPVNVFRAVLADGSRVKGIVFPGELVWDDNPPPRANTSPVGKCR